MNYMDSNLFISIRDGVEFYYFGNGCIADYYGESIAYLDDDDVSLIMLCDGIETILDYIKKINIISNNNDIIKNKIENMRRKGVLIINNKPQKCKAKFYGERGMFYPKRLAIEITSSCNFRCPFCYKGANAFGNYITDDIIDNIIETINGNVGLVTFTGGEPTIHPNFVKYIEQFSDKTPHITMITNGSKLYKYSQYTSTLQKLDYIQFSMYGRDDDEYKIMTGDERGFTHLQRSVEFAKNNDIGVRLSLTLSNRTIHFIKEFVEAAKTINPDELLIGFVDNYGRGKYEDASEFLAEQKNAMKIINCLRRNNKDTIRIREAYQAKMHGYKKDNNDINENVYRGALFCGAGSEELVISSSGKIRPCHYLPEDIFSVQSSNALFEHIHGDFHIAQLNKAVEMYLEMRKADNYEPCRGMNMY